MVETLTDLRGAFREQEVECVLFSGGVSGVVVLPCQTHGQSKAKDVIEQHTTVQGMGLPTVDAINNRLTRRSEAPLKGSAS